MSIPFRASAMFIISVFIGMGAWMLHNEGEPAYILRIALIMTAVGCSTTIIWWFVTKPRRQDPYQRPRFRSPLMVAGVYTALVGTLLVASVVAGQTSTSSIPWLTRALASIGLGVTSFWWMLNTAKAQE